MAGDQVDKILKITFRNQVVAVIPDIFMGIILVFLLFLFDYNYGMQISFSVGYALNIIPVIFLHTEYWLLNKEEKYDIQFDRIIKYKNGEKKEYLVSDIEAISIYLSPALYRGSNFHIFGIEYYHFARVYLKSGEVLQLTCLLTPKLEKALHELRGIKVERKKRIFNTTLL